MFTVVELLDAKEMLTRMPYIVYMFIVLLIFFLSKLYFIFPSKKGGEVKYFLIVFYIKQIEVARSLLDSETRSKYSWSRPRSPTLKKKKRRIGKECFLIDVSRFGFDSSTASIVVTTPVWMINFFLFSCSTKEKLASVVVT